MKKSRIWALLLLLPATSSRAADPGGCTDPVKPAQIGEVSRDCVKDPVLKSDVPDLSSLKTPSSPAQAALGLSSALVERPTSPADTAATLATGFANGTLTPLQNFALDMAPYWLVSHPTLTANDVAQEGWRSVYRRFSISLATAAGEASTAPEPTPPRIALGARTTLWPGTPSPAARMCAEVIRRHALSRAFERAGALGKFLKEWESSNPAPRSKQKQPSIAREDGETDAHYQARFDEWVRREQLLNAAVYAEIEAWNEARDQALRGWRETFDAAAPPPAYSAIECVPALLHRNGFMLDAAAAWVWTVPEGKLSEITKRGIRTTSAWITGGYVLGDGIDRGEGTPFEFSLLAVFRWQKEKQLGITPVPPSGEPRRIDTGARAILAWARWGVSTEGVYRQEKTMAETKNLYRVALSVDHRLSVGTWLAITFGKAFGDGVHSPLLALANLQWNFSKDRTAIVDVGGEDLQP